MKKKIIVLLMIGIVSLSLVGCGNNYYENQNTTTENFNIISKDNLGGDDELWIVQEKTTGKKFIIFKGYRKGGITNLD